MGGGANEVLDRSLLEADIARVEKILEGLKNELEGERLINFSMPDAEAGKVDKIRGEEANCSIVELQVEEAKTKVEGHEEVNCSTAESEVDKVRGGDEVVNSLKREAEVRKSIVEGSEDVYCSIVEEEVQSEEKVMGADDEINCSTIPEFGTVERIPGGRDDVSCSMTSTTLVLMGKTGNGKSSTGNSLLGYDAFTSRLSFSSVTQECKLQKTTLKDGRVLNVIDTPGLFDSGVSKKNVVEEIIKCIDLAKDGVHGVLLVLSVRNRFTLEEASVVKDLQKLFGPRIINYMVVIFTGGDEWLNSKKTLEDYLPEPTHELQELLRCCNNRMILLNNKTAAEEDREKQRNELLKKIDNIITDNGGLPYSNELFPKAQAMSLKSKKEKEKALAEQFRHLKDEMERNQLAICSQLEEKLRMIQITLQEQFLSSARKQAEEARHDELAQENNRLRVKLAQENKRLQEELDQAHRDFENMKNQWRCTIM